MRAGSYVYSGSIARVFASSWGSLVPVRSSVCGSRAVVASASLYIYVLQYERPTSMKYVLVDCSARVRRARGSLGALGPRPLFWGVCAGRRCWSESKQKGALETKGTLASR